MPLFYLIKTLRDQTLRYQIKFKKLHLMITSGLFLKYLTIFMFNLFTLQQIFLKFICQTQQKFLIFISL